MPAIFWQNYKEIQLYFFFSSEFALNFFEKLIKMIISKNDNVAFGSWHHWAKMEAVAPYINNSLKKFFVNYKYIKTT